MIDPKARQVLFDAYWSPHGWKVPRDEPSPADLAYAKSRGVMFDTETLTHDDALDRIVAARSRTDAASVAEAFVASLVSRQVHLRPALASFFAVQNTGPHRFVGHLICATCRLFPRSDYDFSATNFARLKWGAAPQASRIDDAFILERFAVESKPLPSNEDRAVLDRLLGVADSLGDEARARDLEKAWRPLIRSSREERNQMIEILVACEVLFPSRRTPADFHRIPPRSSWTEHAALWRGDDGVHRERAAVLFGWK